MSRQAHLADGTVLEFPDGTKDDVIDRVVKQHLAAPAKASLKKDAAGGSYGLQDLATNKFTMGLSDKAIPIADAALSYLTGGKGSFSDRYQAAQTQRDQDREAYQAAHPVTDWATLPLNIMGGGGAGAVNAGVRGIVATGAGAGLVSSLGNSRGSGQAGQIMAGTGVGAALAPAVAAVAPLAVRGGRNATRAVVNRITGKTTATPPTNAGKILLKTLADQGTTPAQAAKMIDDARANGVPLALMDTGDETRGLASGLSRKSGPNRTLIRDAVISRQEGQTERVQSAIARDLGRTANVRTQSDALIKNAQTTAAPLYEKAYANPVPDSEMLQTLAQRPSMKGALKRAYGIAQEEGRDPRKVGFNLDAEGNVTVEKHNSTQTWDYVKRGLDDVIEANRDPVTGKLKLDEAGRAVNATQRQFITELDRLNPDYAAARSAYAGPAKMASALSKGSRIGNKDSETILAETQNLSAPELEQYKLGVRSTLSKMLEGRTDAADKVKALVGTPKKRAVLTQLFGGRQSFDRFMATLAQEGQAAATHARVNTGSPTAANLADDATVEGLGGVALNAGVRAVKGQGMIHNAFHTLADLAKYGSGKAGEELRAQVAAGISETDPVVLAEALRQARRAAAANRISGKGGQGAKVPAAIAAGRAGAALSSLANK